MNKLGGRDRIFHSITIGGNSMKRRTKFLMGGSALALTMAQLPVLAVGVDDDTIIVTGTRDVGVKAQESPTPIAVIGADTLEATGQNNVFDALRNVLPSFSASVNGDTSEMVRSARLRGMSPGEVLVLVNGKRRHTSANVNADPGPDVSSNPTDLDMIPMSLIDHVEVLMDGAAAQYGSDAVAGVVNIILKNGSSGTMITAGAGISSRGDGAQANGGFSQSLALGNGGFIDVSVDYKHQDFLNRSGVDQYSYGLTYGPVRDRVFGAPLADLTIGGFNADRPIDGDLEFYAFGTAGWRGAQAFENDRLGNVAPTVWPQGFFPRETLNEVDASITAGIKGSHLLGGWDWDLSTTYGRDSDDIGVKNTVNPGLANPVNPTNSAINAGLGLYSPINVYAGNETNAQLTSNLDFRRPFDVDLFASPLNVAFGFEFRHETYSVSPGDPASYEDGGTQSYAGFTPSASSNSSRNVEAVYVDLSTKILPRWTVDLAGRFESYDSIGVGNTENGKLTTRYDITPNLAVRGTISDGFHAPTLAQSNFATTNINPLPGGGQSYYIQLPLSSPGAALLGASALKPETSKDLDFGVVAEPIEKLHVSLDAYQIFLDHRVINSGYMSGDVALAAAAANGNVTPSGSVAYVSFFNNGVDTRTRGLDFSSDYKADLGHYGNARWTLNGNYNETAITKQYAIPSTLQAALRAAGSAPTYLTPNVINDLTKSSPQSKLSLAMDYMFHDLDITLRETRYGHTDQKQGSSAIVPYDNIFIKSAYITDIDIGYYVAESVKLDVGGNNVFDHMPGHLTASQKTTSNKLSDIYPTYTPWGFTGAYFYTRITASF